MVGFYRKVCLGKAWKPSKPLLCRGEDSLELAMVKSVTLLNFDIINNYPSCRDITGIPVLGSKSVWNRSTISEAKSVRSLVMLPWYTFDTFFKSNTALIRVNVFPSLHFTWWMFIAEIRLWSGSVLQSRFTQLRSWDRIECIIQKQGSCISRWDRGQKSHSLWSRLRLHLNNAKNSVVQTVDNIPWTCTPLAGHHSNFLYFLSCNQVYVYRSQSCIIPALHA